MPAQLNRLVFLSAIPAAFVALCLSTSVTAASNIYRCGPEGSQWYSQIPCEENSEAVIVEDRHMFNEGGEDPSSQEAATDTEETDAGAEAAAASNAQAFITQLEKQRSEQLAEIDLRIQELENRTVAVSNSTADSAESDAGVSTNVEAEDGQDGSPDADSSDQTEAAEAARLLANLRNSRESIVSEYDAMINAARQGSKNP